VCLPPVARRRSSGRRSSTSTCRATSSIAAVRSAGPTTPRRRPLATVVDAIIRSSSLRRTSSGRASSSGRKLAGVPVTDYELHILTADGRRVRAEISSVPIGGGNACDAVFGVAQIGPVARRPSQRAPRLTPRQMEVLHLLADGSSTNQIARALHLSRETVRNYVRQLLRALGAHSRLEAVANARREGLLLDV